MTKKSRRSQLNTKSIQHYDWNITAARNSLTLTNSWLDYLDLGQKRTQLWTDMNIVTLG